MIRLFALLLALLGAPAVAQDALPALFDVTGVAGGDVLNVRAEPSASAPILGSFGPAETGIEVIAFSDDGAWGRVNTGEQAGWAAMRYLARQPGQGAGWDAGLDCFGTEPFWRLALMPGGGLTWSALGFADGTPLPGGYEPVGRSASTGKRGFFGWLETEPVGLTGIVATELCSDGMSDRDYGVALDLIVSDTDGDRLVSGCCTLRP